MLLLETIQEKIALNYKYCQISYYILLKFMVILQLFSKCSVKNYQCHVLE